MFLVLLDGLFQVSLAGYLFPLESLTPLFQLNKVTFAPQHNVLHNALLEGFIFNDLPLLVHLQK